MLEIGAGIAICWSVGELASLSNRSRQAWFGITFLICALSILIPLPYLRFIIAGIVSIIIMMITTKI